MISECSVIPLPRRVHLCHKRAGALRFIYGLVLSFFFFLVRSHQEYIQRSHRHVYVASYNSHLSRTLNTTEQHLDARFRWWASRISVTQRYSNASGWFAGLSARDVERNADASIGMNRIDQRKSSLTSLSSSLCDRWD